MLKRLFLMLGCLNSTLLFAFNIPEESIDNYLSAIQTVLNSSEGIKQSYALKAFQSESKRVARLSSLKDLFSKEDLPLVIELLDFVKNEQAYRNCLKEFQSMGIFDANVAMKFRAMVFNSVKTFLELKGVTFPKDCRIPKKILEANQNIAEETSKYLLFGTFALVYFQKIQQQMRSLS